MVISYVYHQMRARRNTGGTVEGTPVSRLYSCGMGRRHDSRRPASKKGDPFAVGARCRGGNYAGNPITVLKAYQQLVGEELVETRRRTRQVRQFRRARSVPQGRKAEVSYRSMPHRRNLRVASCRRSFWLPPKEVAVRVGVRCRQAKRRRSPHLSIQLQILH